MRTTLAYLTSVLVHVSALVVLASYIPVNTGPKLHVNSGLTIVASFSNPATEAEPEAAVVIAEAEPLPEEEVRPVEAELEITPGATHLARQEVRVREIIPVDAVPAEKDETPPPQTAAKQPPQENSPPPPEQTAKKPAARQSKTAIEIAAHSIVMPPQAAVATGAKVDRLPQEFFSNRKPAYPPEEARAGVTGVLYVRCLIAASGFVQSASVAKSSGSARLDKAAVTAVRTYQFEPAQRGGIAIPIEVILPFDFVIR